PNPLVPLRIFRLRTLTGGNVVRFLLGFGSTGWLFMMALYLEHVLRFDPLRTGLAFLPQTTVIAVMQLTLTTRLIVRFGSKAPLLAGLAFVTAGFAAFALVGGPGTYLTAVLPGMLLS